MSNLNKVFLMGNLTRDPEVKYLDSGAAIGRLGIAVNNTYKGADGEMKKEVDFFTISVFGKAAENCAKYLTKGRPIFVEARLKPRSWDDPETGKKRYVTEIVANQVQFLGSGQGGGGDKPAASQQQDEPAGGYGPGDEVPF